MLAWSISFIIYFSIVPSIQVLSEKLYPTEFGLRNGQCDGIAFQAAS